MADVSEGNFCTRNLRVKIRPQDASSGRESGSALLFFRFFSSSRSLSDMGTERALQLGRGL